MESNIANEKAICGSDHIDQLPRAEMPSTIQYDEDEERKAVRKLDMHLIPIIFLINMCSFLDRGNIGNAYTGGLNKHIKSDQFEWLITILFLGYLCFQWTILLWKLVSPPVLVLVAAVGWGTLSMLQGTATTFARAMVCRLFLGIFEALFAPGIPLFLSFYYNRKEIGLRYGLFLSSAALASCFASALAYGILQAHTSIEGWQLLFVVEGSPTIILAFVAYYLLPSRSNQCRFLTERENAIVSTRAIKARGVEEDRKLNFKQVFAAFYDYKNYLSAIIIFCLNSTYNSLPAFLPTIIADIGIGDALTSQGLSAPPYLAAFVLCISFSTISDRVGRRGVFISGLCSMGGLGYLLLSIINTPGVRYFSTFLVCGGCFPAVALTFTWMTDNQGSASKRGAGLVIFGMIGQAGSIAGAHFFPASERPKYVKGMAICAALLFFGALVSQVLSFCLRMQNRSRDKKFGKSDPNAVPSEIFDLGDEHPMYRYII